MTLVISVTTSLAAYQVSDRRITRLSAGGRHSVHSGLENKSLIFICKDAVGTIGYTGLAYIGGMPTDQFLANALAPQPIGSPPLGTFGFGGRGMGGVRLQTLIWKLRNAIKSAQLHPRAQHFEVALAGFRVRRHRCIPFQTEISRSSTGTKIVGFMRLPRNRRQRVAVSQIGDNFPGNEILSHLEEGASKQLSADGDRLLAGMVNAVRVRSAQSKTVGADLMAITVPHPGISREIVWSFKPASRHAAQIVGGGDTIEFDAIYSPWVLTPATVFCPSVGTGGWNIECGGWTFINKDSDTVSSRGGTGRRILFASSSQKRAPPP